jgi:transposase-like protein
MLLRARQEKTYLVSVPNRNAETLMAVFRNWIECDTTVIGDSWSAYQNIETNSFRHQIQNHAFGFVDVRNGAQRNTTESMMCLVKGFLIPTNGCETRSIA